LRRSDSTSGAESHRPAHEAMTEAELLPTLRYGEKTIAFATSSNRCG
jgi:hypothetical protein